MLLLLLKNKGFTLIDQCADGKEAVDCVSAKGNDYYDLIFLDNFMPTMVSPSIYPFIYSFIYLSIYPSIWSSIIEWTRSVVYFEKERIQTSHHWIDRYCSTVHRVRYCSIVHRVRYCSAEYDIRRNSWNLVPTSSMDWWIDRWMKHTKDMWFL